MASDGDLDHFDMKESVSDNQMRYFREMCVAEWSRYEIDVMAVALVAAVNDTSWNLRCHITRTNDSNIVGLYAGIWLVESNPDKLALQS